MIRSSIQNHVIMIQILLISFEFPLRNFRPLKLFPPDAKFFESFQPCSSNIDVIVQEERNNFIQKLMDPGLILKLLEETKDLNIQSTLHSLFLHLDEMVKYFRYESLSLYKIIFVYSLSMVIISHEDLSHIAFEQLSFIHNHDDLAELLFNLFLKRIGWIQIKFDQEFQQWDTTELKSSKATKTDSKFDLYFVTLYLLIRNLYY